MLLLLGSSGNGEDHEEELDEGFEYQEVDDGSNTCAAVFGEDAAACLAVSNERLLNSILIVEHLLLDA